MPKESSFQREVIEKLEAQFPGCVVLKNDPNYIQGIPDLSVFHGLRWGVLECKKSDRERYEPNQEYYLDLFNRMSFGAMICPENEEEIFDALQRSFSTCRSTRVSKREQVSLG